MKNEDVKETAVKKAVFAKAKLLKAEKYALYVDVLNTLLEDGKSYAISTVDEILNKFLKKGKVFK